MNIEKLLFESIEEIVAVYSLASVFTKTKTERFLFPIIAGIIEKRIKLENPNLIALVEYNCKEINEENKNRKADLAIGKLDEEGRLKEIVSIVEGKVYYTFNTLLKPNWERIRDTAFAYDIDKLTEIKSNIDRYFVLFLIDYGPLIVPEFFKYYKGHNTTIERMKGLDYDFDEEKMVSTVRKRVTTLFKYFELHFNPNSIKQFYLGTYNKQKISLFACIGKL